MSDLSGRGEEREKREGAPPFIPDSCVSKNSFSFYARQNFAISSLGSKRAFNILYLYLYKYANRLDICFQQSRSLLRTRFQSSLHGGYEVESYEPLNLGDATAHAGWCLHWSPPQPEDCPPRYALSVCYFVAGHWTARPGIDCPPQC